MSANTYLNITEVDFADIKSNLKSYLQSQTQFNDYDFEGSNMSVLLDVLSYNTHYNAFYTNMLGNEMFLDTAQQRDSVVSRAKELGYLTRSARGASANVSITFSGISNSISEFELPKNTTFTTNINDRTFTFVTPEANIIKNVSNTFTKAITIDPKFYEAYFWRGALQFSMKRRHMDKTDRIACSDMRKAYLNDVSYAIDFVNKNKTLLTKNKCTGFK